MTIKPSRQTRRAGRRGVLAAPQRQRGAAAVFGAVALIAAVASLLLGINIGRLYYAQRALQQLAVMGAMAGAQISSGCRNSGTPATSTGSGSTLWNQVQQAITANNGNNSSAATSVMTGIGTHAAVEVGWVNTFGGQSITDGGTTYTAPSDGLRHFVALPSGDSNTNINAVRVNLTQAAPALIGGTFFPGAATLIKASATAMEQPVGAFSLGSTLVSLNTSNSLLNPLLGALLGTSVNLTAVNYQSLASTQISLANLMVAAGVNNLNSLLSLSGNAFGADLTLLANAANLVNPTAANVITGLTLGSYQKSQTVPLANVLGNVGDGLNPAVTDAAALAPSLNLLDLLMQVGEQAAAQQSASNPSSFLTLQGTPSVPGLASTYVFLQVQQPMQPGSGPVGASASTSQVTIRVRATVDPSGLSPIETLLQTLTLNIVTLTPSTINIGLDLVLAGGTGTLSSLSCPSDTGTPAGVPVANVAVTANFAKLSLGTFIGAASSDPILSPTGGSLVSITSPQVFGITTLALNVSTDAPVGPVDLGSGSGTAGPFEIYASPPSQLSSTQTDVYTYFNCNDLVASSSPVGALNPCYPTTDPNNPDTPVTSGNLGAGISTLVSDLVAQGNLHIVVTVLGINITVTSTFLNSLLSDLNTLLLAPLDNLLGDLLDSLLQALGIQVGSATVLMNSVTTGQPVIVTTTLP